MSDMPSGNIPGDRIVIAAAPSAGPEQGQSPRRRRRGLRIALVTMASLVVLIGGVVVGGYAYVNHLAGSIPRIPVKFARLDAATGGNYGGATTVLITGKGIGPTGTQTEPEDSSSGLIMLMHVNATGYSGGVVSIPPQSIVRAITLRDMIRCIESALNIPALPEPRPDQPGDVPRTCADIRKARSLLGYQPNTDRKSVV